MWRFYIPCVCQAFTSFHTTDRYMSEDRSCITVVFKSVRLLVSQHIVKALSGRNWGNRDIEWPQARSSPSSFSGRPHIRAFRFMKLHMILHTLAQASAVSLLKLEGLFKRRLEARDPLVRREASWLSVSESGQAFESTRQSAAWKTHTEAVRQRY